MARRVVQAVATIFIILTAIFFLLNVLPGDAALLAGDPRLARDPAAMDAIRTKWGLDAPLHIRYFRYIGNLLRGDLGVSFHTSTQVSERLSQALIPTLKIVLLAFVIAVFIGVMLGFIAAVKRGTFVDLFCMVFAILGISVPRFWLGLLLMYYFAVNQRLLPASGYGDGSLRFMVLPAITLSVPMIALLARTTRASVLDVLEEDYVRTARSKGLSERVINFKHIFRNALISVVTIAGLELGVMFANTVVVEKVFAWPGIGSMVVNGIIRRDIPVVQGNILIFALSFILINLTIDIFYAFLDPRITYN